MLTNLPAPEVPRRGSLAARDTNGQICQTGTASAGGGAFSTEQGAKKSARDGGNLRVLQIGPTSSKCAVSIQHVRSIGPTWGQLRRARPQLRPN